MDFDQDKQLRPDFTFRFVRAAHIVGSSMVEVTMQVAGKQQKLLFTGDIGRVHDSQIAPGRVLHYGPTEGESADLLVMESTYGNRLHPKTDPRPELAELIRNTVNRGGSVVVPAFAVERTQKFLFMLKELMEAGEIPRIPVFADSPMAIEAVKIFLKHSEEFSEEAKALITKYGSPLAWQGFTLCEDAGRVEEDQRDTISVRDRFLERNGDGRSHSASSAAAVAGSAKPRALYRIPGAGNARRNYQERRGRGEDLRRDRAPSALRWLRSNSSAIMPIRRSCWSGCKASRQRRRSRTWCTASRIRQRN